MSSIPDGTGWEYFECEQGEDVPAVVVSISQTDGPSPSSSLIPTSCALHDPSLSLVYLALII